MIIFIAPFEECQKQIIDSLKKKLLNILEILLMILLKFLEKYYYLFGSLELNLLHYTSTVDNRPPWKNQLKPFRSVHLVRHIIVWPRRTSQHLPSHFHFLERGLLEDLQRCSVCDPAQIFFTSEVSYLLFFLQPHPSNWNWSPGQWFFFGKKSPNGDTVFWKRNILSQIPCFWEKNSPIRYKKTGFLGMVSLHLCLLATLFRVSWDKFAS